MDQIEDLIERVISKGYMAEAKAKGISHTSEYKNRLAELSMMEQTSNQRCKEFDANRNWHLVATEIHGLLCNVAESLTPDELGDTAELNWLELRTNVNALVIEVKRDNCSGSPSAPDTRK